MAKTYWNDLESRVRSTLRTFVSYNENEHADAGDLALLLIEISDALGEATGRGYEVTSHVEPTILARWGIPQGTDQKAAG